MDSHQRIFTKGISILDTKCNGGDDCCSASNKCGVGEGDCDSDNDCKDGLTCGTNNCVGAGFDSTDDCCEGM